MYSHGIKEVTLFAIAAWRIRTTRSRTLFGTEELDDLGADLVRNIMHISQEIVDVHSKKVKVPAPDCREVRCFPPPSCWVNFNTSGASHGNTGVAGASGLIRDSWGCWLAGFVAHFGSCSNTVVELHAIRLSLLVAWEEGLRQVICEVDALVI